MVSTRPRTITRTTCSIIPTKPYIVFNDLPKVRNFQRLLPALYNAKPVTVAASKPRQRGDRPADQRAQSGDRGQRRR